MSFEFFGPMMGFLYRPPSPPMPWVDPIGEINRAWARAELAHRNDRLAAAMVGA